MNLFLCNMHFLKQLGVHGECLGHILTGGGD